MIKVHSSIYTTMHQNSKFLIAFDLFRIYTTTKNSLDIHEYLFVVCILQTGSNIFIEVQI
jgi:hypothetical protein